MFQFVKWTHKPNQTKITQEVFVIASSSAASCFYLPESSEVNMLICPH